MFKKITNNSQSEKIFLNIQKIRLKDINKTNVTL